MIEKAPVETHRTWQEAVGMALGTAVALSPWLTSQVSNSKILVGTAAAGSFVLLLSALQLMTLTRLKEWATLFMGLWLWIAPFSLDYIPTPLGLVHLLLGPAIAVLAALELWQDWSKSDNELERYGG